MTTMCRMSTSTAESAEPAASRVNQQAAPELEHVDRAGPATTTCGTPTSTQIGAQPAAGHLDQAALPELHHDYRAGSMTTTCGKSSSAHISIEVARRHPISTDTRCISAVAPLAQPNYIDLAHDRTTE